MEVFKNIFEFLTDSNKRLSAKAAMILAVLSGLFLLNDITGFTYYYNTKNKIEQIKALNDILQDSLISPDTKQQALQLQLRIFKRKTLAEKTVLYTSSLYSDTKSFINGYSKRIKQPGESTKITTVTVAREIIPQNNFLFVVTSCGIFLFVGILMIPVTAWFGFEKGLAIGISSVIAVVGVFAALSFSFYSLLSLLPSINGVWRWNYLINSIVQLSSIILVILAINKENEKKKYRVKI